MIHRSFWKQRIFDLLPSKNVLWLAGVRRVGKTMLCQSLEDAQYFDCELPRVRSQLEDPEFFFSRHDKKLIVLDEIHRLLNPSEPLKIAADHFPKIKVVATGSSTLSARRKFRDTLAGRKNELWLTPAILADLEDFGTPNLDDRMLKGGLPPFLLGAGVDDNAYSEWIESYWSKDIQELFVVEKKAAFMKFMELLFHQSGDLFEAQPFTAACEISRQTVQNYLHVLETTMIVTILRPFRGSSASEIKSQPKVYAFDTGFVCYFRGIDSIHYEDRGHLLEHLVLGEILSRHPRNRVFFWRDKQKHEVDFVLKLGRGENTLAIECKSKPSRFDPAGLLSFRRRHPQGRNLVVCIEVIEPIEKRFDELLVEFIPFKSIPKFI